MILEQATLQVIEGKEKAFEIDFIKASKYISAIKGYQSHSLKKCIEQKNKYLLLVKWDTIEAHEVGFRQSKEYIQWKNLLHHYYDPFPIVEHYESIFENNIKKY